MLLHTPEGGIADATPYRLSTGRHLVGRSVEEDEGITLDDARASRHHATFHVSSRTARVRVADEDSRNGTWVNGERVDEAWLEDGDVVRLADSHLLFRLQPDDADDADIPGLIGRAPAVRALRSTLARVASHDVVVLITGQSGTGKEVAARAIHELSRREGPFVAINCAAIPEQLAESQLFGHRAGAFTGASQDHEGLFRAAHGGTVFLDEIGDLPTPLQPKLLRALEERAVVPVGVTAAIPFDARVVAATNVSLAGAIADGEFRGDLYARLAEFEVALPPLRDRREDVLLLMRDAFDAGELPPMDPELVALLLLHPWPFNVRELRAVARELAVRGGDKDALTANMVSHRLAAPVDPDETLGRDSSDDDTSGSTSGSTSASTSGSTAGGKRRSSSGRSAPPTREELEAILARCEGNVRAIARETGRSRMQVYRWVEQHGLDLANYRDD